MHFYGNLGVFVASLGRLGGIFSVSLGVSWAPLCVFFVGHLLTIPWVNPKSVESNFEVKIYFFF